MTNKELLYIEDALSHEKFMQSCACKTSKQIQDAMLSTYVEQLEKTHLEHFNKFLNLL